MPGVYIAFGASRARVPFNVSNSGGPTSPRTERLLFLVIEILRFFHHHRAKILQISFDLDLLDVYKKKSKNETELVAISGRVRVTGQITVETKKKKKKKIERNYKSGFHNEKDQVIASYFFSFSFLFFFPPPCPQADLISVFVGSEHAKTELPLFELLWDENIS